MPTPTDTLEPPHYPIIYVRGYAATMSEIEDTVATPYMGFNLGSTKLRQDHAGKPAKFIFESPLIRLIKDFKYENCYEGGEYRRHPDDGGKAVPWKSVWVFRYYEPVSEDLGDGDRLTIPQFAVDLREFILQVRKAICGTDKAAQKAFKVNLVAHSMGGLVCRCYLQNICRFGLPERASKKKSEKEKKLELTGTGGDPLVNKVFTYGTPHNGIEIQGINVPDVESIDSIHVRNFNRGYMADYLKLKSNKAYKKSGRVSSLDGAFEPRRFFCFVGTNYKDYEAFFGLSKKGTGPMSDGLVMCRNAYVDGAPRAFAHRAHSGDYGIVNSEEGYQNLRRFLFGSIRVDVRLEVDELTLPRAVYQHLKLDEAKTDAARKKALKRLKASYHIESSAQVRTGNIKLHERRVDQESALFRTYEQLTKPTKRRSIYLFSGFLDPGAKPAAMTGDQHPMAFSVGVAVKVPLYEIDEAFWFDEHFEGASIFEDTVTFHVNLGAKDAPVKYGLVSADGVGQAPHDPASAKQSKGELRIEIPLGFTAGEADKNPGKMRARLVAVARPEA